MYQYDEFDQTFVEQRARQFARLADRFLVGNLRLPCANGYII